MSLDERYEQYRERHETPEFLERVKDFREELKKLKRIEEDDSPEPDEETRKARQNLSEDQERLAAELDAIIKGIGENLKRAAGANIPLLPANSAELSEWYESAMSPLTELTFLRMHLHQLRKLGIYVPLFGKTRRKLREARIRADRLGLVHPGDWHTEDQMREYERIDSLMTALGVTVLPAYRRQSKNLARLSKIE